ncbi:DUF5672 family protein [Siphonobacter sp. SORGH_AS_0500]|uniref:DUF5672 family protein n=2 Tax=Siphonobacter sp. SORGH_AS_0500 TaxID=1864824 RepID=UPI000CA7479E|nr:DUF5672 family protein [Siphonobacter sp. SORGH_AS_0500]MDR6194868.1 hypothetical protein [Siphonobacter sp. SORGH_AS_0500]PKK38542.1 hypothetical protein BWI96_01870 [Siphonobacter sp. SORGH_AS_0500]
MPSSALVAVVIPIYRSEMNEFEKISLQQCVQKLGHYPIIIVKPQSLDVSYLQTFHTSFKIQSFHDDYFKGIDAYNLLLTQPDFYLSFQQYQYILIYQLDAFVFHDELEVWCKKGYDYIGAPYLSPNASKQSITDLKKPLLNGGLSLRNVQASLKLIHLYKQLYGQWPGNEDMLFSLHSTRLFVFRPFMKLPEPKEALAFSFEQFPEYCYELNQKKLPFGCHAWEKYNLNFWRPFFQQSGYKLH